MSRYTPFQLDKTRNLHYGMRALDRIESKFKKNVMNLDLDELSMREMATVIWAGLVHEDEKLTVDKVMDLIDQHSDITTALTVMTEAFISSFGVKSEEESKNE